MKGGEKEKRLYEGIRESGLIVLLNFDVKCFIQSY